MAMHIVLVNPEIPPNTGNVARTCAATGTVLHLVRPLGFNTDDKTLKRAGLDYWHLVDIRYHDSLAEVEAAFAGHRFFYASTKVSRRYTDVSFLDGDFLVFGPETRGLPESLLDAHPERGIRIPMIPGARSLNLGNSVATVLFEAYRQLRPTWY